MDEGESTYRTLLESTKAIPWRIDWKSMRFSYIGPQIEPLLGYAQDSWATVDDWASRMHPDDRERVVSFCVAQSQSGIDHEADYRALAADGSFVWIRDVVHVVRKDGDVEALVGFMFDITERKRNEEELHRLQRELEALSYNDGLTGVANRRRFDQILEQAWDDAIVREKPLSLALFDIDFFKQFNDNHGHLAGDDCLKQVAALLTRAARPGDVVARIGGEEFALILRDTDRDTAVAVADGCRHQVVDAAMPHGHSVISDFVTVSVGTRTVMPNVNDSVRRLFESADAALYQAKGSGRNRVHARLSSIPPA